MADTGYLKALLTSDRKVWGDAVLEILVVAFVSLAPLFIGAIREVLPLSGEPNFLQAVSRSFLSGQLIFYAVGFIATVVWQCNTEIRAFAFWRHVLNFYCSIGLMVVAIFSTFDPTLASINRRVLAESSIGLFLTSLLAYFLMAMITRINVNIPKSLADEDAQLKASVERIRGEQ